VEGRLDEPTPAVPGFPLERQQAVAQEQAGVPEGPVLDEVPTLGRQDLFDEVGVTEQDGPKGAEPQGDEIAIAAGALAEEVERAAPD
jgi:hypothetical protein